MGNETSKIERGIIRPVVKLRSDPILAIEKTSANPLPLGE